MLFTVTVYLFLEKKHGVDFEKCPTKVYQWIFGQFTVH